MKRGFDVLGATVLLAVSAILFIVVSILIFAHDRGPVFYSQTRVGREKQQFGMLKFRTMVVNADKIGSYQTTAGDPRITKVGGFLRRTSLDELPQLLNVLLGHMSLVGPRPDVPEQEALYASEDWDLRNSVRPGITGLAQAVGRSQMDFETRTKLDLDYVRNASVWTDLKVLWMTLATLRKGI